MNPSLARTSDADDDATARGIAAPFDTEVDLLVIGAGAAGMTAALVAAIEGFEVLLCEKSGQVGGTSARSSGGIWVPGSSKAAAQDAGDPLATARTYLAGQMRTSDKRGLREAYLQTGPQAIDYLEKNSDVAFAAMPTHPDYKSLDGAAMEGRALGTVPFDGRLLGADFKTLAAPLPSLTALGGMMVGRADVAHLLNPFASMTSLSHCIRMVGRYLVDRLSHSRGTSLLMGNALAARLLYSLRKRKVPIWVDSSVTSLIRDGRRVIGAVVRNDHEPRRVKARHGVVLATGGFSHSPLWRDRLMTEAERKTLSLTPPTNTGDGLTLARDADASVARGDLRSSSVWAPVSIMRVPDREPVMFPHFFMDRPKPGFIAVNKAGARFVNEAASYHDFVAGMLASEQSVGSLPAYLVCDSKTLRKYGMGLVLPGRRSLKRYVDSGYLVKAGSLAELARECGIDAQTFEQTVACSNGFARAGTDPEFGKGSSAFNRFHGDAAHQPNPCLGTIEQAPYFAVEIWPADLSTCAGVAADSNCQALDAQSDAIPGLHVCGNDMESIWEGEAPGPGVTLGPAIVFGYRAAMHAVRTRPPEPSTPDPIDTPSHTETAHVL